MIDDIDLIKSRLEMALYRAGDSPEGNQEIIKCIEALIRKIVKHARRETSVK